MIRIGLTGWGDHPALYGGHGHSRDKLRIYSEFFPVVEVDSVFYAVASERNYQRWSELTPDSFSFVVKAYQGMTAHIRDTGPFPDRESMFTAFLRSIAPLQESGKLRMILFQYPPWFDCTRLHVDELRDARARMGNLPVALEFRHRSWFEPLMIDKTLTFLQGEGWIHSICDEPQTKFPYGSIPTVLCATHPDQTLVRLHGRNVQGWESRGQRSRDVRCLYRYSEAELLEWKTRLEALQRETREITVLFNNNSGGDAAGNARQLMGLLGQPVPSLTAAAQSDGIEGDDGQLNLFVPLED